MKINFAHLCDYALVSNGKLSVLGIFDQVRPTAMPWVHPTLYVAFQIGLDQPELGSRVTTRLVIEDEDGGKLFTGEGDIQTVKEKAKIGEQRAVGQVVCINGLVFKQPGPCQIVIWLQGQVAHTLRFTVLAPVTQQNA